MRKICLLKKLLLCIILLSAILTFSLLSINAIAQSAPDYYVTITPVIPEKSLMYTTVGHNWTLSFEALWSYGAQTGKPIENATVIIEVRDPQKIVEELSFNTTLGVFSFNYSSNSADILKFKPTILITQNNEEYITENIDSTNGVFGLKSAELEVWWDTFQVALLNYDTSSLQNVAVTVNVTYKLLPEEGLTLPAWATYSNQTFLPKIIHNSTVKINGIIAQETQTPGIYHVNYQSALPTTYVNVEVSQNNWTTTHTAFCFSHQVNQQIWNYIIIVIIIVVLAIVVFKFYSLRKKRISSFKLSNFPVLGGIFLIASAFISLYWGIVSLEGFLHTFEWLTFTLLYLLSFVFGFISSVFVFRKRYQAIAVFAVCIPLIVNTVIVKSLLDMYQLPNPWLLIMISVGVSVLSAFFICNSDRAFEKEALTEESMRLV